MGNMKFAALAPAMLVAIALAGCNGFPGLRRPADPAEAAVLGKRPGPMKQLATSVGESSFGQSVSKVFRLATTKKHKPPTNDPTSLATKVKPITPEDYVKLGNRMEQNGDAEGARESFHKALEMQPHHLGALLGLARLFDRQGQFDRATEHYVEAAKYHPKDATTFNDMGLCYARQGKYEQSAAALRHAIELKPDSMLYRNNISTVLVAQGRNDEALAHLIDAHGPAVAHYNLGWLLNKHGRRELAIEQFQLALAVDPAMERAREAIDALSAPPEVDDGPAETGPAQIAETRVGSGPETPRISRRPRMAESAADSDTGTSRQTESSETPPQDPFENRSAPDSSMSPAPLGPTSSRRRTVVAPPSVETAPNAISTGDAPPEVMQPLPPVDASSVHPSRY